MSSSDNLPEHLSDLSIGTENYPFQSKPQSGGFNFFNNLFGNAPQQTPQQTQQQIQSPSEKQQETDNRALAFAAVGNLEKLKQFLALNVARLNVKDNNGKTITDYIQDDERLASLRTSIDQKLTNAQIPKFTEMFVFQSKTPDNQTSSPNMESLSTAANTNTNSPQTPVITQQSAQSAPFDFFGLFKPNTQQRSTSSDNLGTMQVTETATNDAQLIKKIENNLNEKPANTPQDTEELVNKLLQQYNKPQKMYGGYSNDTDVFIRELVSQNGGKHAKSGVRKMKTLSDFDVTSNSHSPTDDDKSNRLARMIENQSDQIHADAVKQIEELLKKSKAKYDDTHMAAKAIKAEFWSNIKEKFPNLSNLDKSIELKKMITEDNVKNAKRVKELVKLIQEKDKIRAEKQSSDKQKSPEQSSEKSSDKPAKKAAKAKKTSEDSLSSTSSRTAKSNGYSSTSNFKPTKYSESSQSSVTSSNTAASGGYSETSANDYY